MTITPHHAAGVIASSGGSQIIVEEFTPLSAFSSTSWPTGIDRVWAGESNLTSTNGEATCFMINSNDRSEALVINFGSFSGINDIPSTAVVSDIEFKWQHRRDASAADQRMQQARWFRDDVNVFETARTINQSSTTSWVEHIFNGTPSFWGMTNSEFVTAWNSTAGCDLYFYAQAYNGVNSTYRVRNVVVTLTYTS